jgi:hypothetical protein
MSILDIIKIHRERSDIITETALPRVVSAQRQLRVLRTLNIVVKSLPLEASSSHLLYTYPYLGQFKNLISIRPFDFASKDKRLSFIAEFSCNISASLAFLVNLLVNSIAQA